MSADAVRSEVCDSESCWRHWVSSRSISRIASVCSSCAFSRHWAMARSCSASRRQSSCTWALRSSSSASLAESAPPTALLGGTLLAAAAVAASSCCAAADDWAANCWAILSTSARSFVCSCRSSSSRWEVRRSSAATCSRPRSAASAFARWRSQAKADSEASRRACASSPRQALRSVTAALRASASSCCTCCSSCCKGPTAPAWRRSQQLPSRCSRRISSWRPLVASMHSAAFCSCWAAAFRASERSFSRMVSLAFSCAAALRSCSKTLRWSANAASAPAASWRSCFTRPCSLCKSQSASLKLPSTSDNCASRAVHLLARCCSAC
mmetsp:Transcript_45466/g.132329  ORF Transcript_45466/g.132329 Transcript_45466/m.132329 type:complete len:325 (+) Transcript_45466:446-1420(+)